MLELDYNERVTHDMKYIPLSFYHVDEKHARYHAPIHWHRPSEMARVLSGELKIHLNDRTVCAKSGDIIYINREVIHGFSPDNCVYEVIDFDIKELLFRTSFCEEGLRLFASKHVIINPFCLNEDKELHALANRLFSVASTQTGEHDLLILGTLFELLGSIILKQQYTENVKTHAQIKVFKPLLEFIQNSYMKPITLNEMAQVSGMSTSHFAVLFRDLFNQTPVDYLNSYRIERACIFLLNSNLSVTEIAYQCGFNDSAYFVKVFKKYKNVTPKKYRIK